MWIRMLLGVEGGGISRSRLWVMLANLVIAAALAHLYVPIDAIRSPSVAWNEEEPRNFALSPDAPAGVRLNGSLKDSNFMGFPSMEMKAHPMTGEIFPMEYAGISHLQVRARSTKEGSAVEGKESATQERESETEGKESATEYMESEAEGKESAGQDEEPAAGDKVQESAKAKTGDETPSRTEKHPSEDERESVAESTPIKPEATAPEKPEAAETPQPEEKTSKEPHARSEAETPSKEESHHAETTSESETLSSKQQAKTPPESGAEVSSKESAAEGRVASLPTSPGVGLAVAEKGVPSPDKLVVQFNFRPSMVLSKKDTNEAERHLVNDKAGTSWYEVTGRKDMGILKIKPMQGEELLHIESVSRRPK